MTTLAQDFKAKAKILMPHQDSLQDLDDAIETTGMVDDIMFHKSEYIGGMANVIMELVVRDRRGQPKV